MRYDGYNVRPTLLLGLCTELLSNISPLSADRKPVGQIYKKVKPLMDALEAAQEAKAAAIADLAKVRFDRRSHRNNRLR